MTHAERLYALRYQGYSPLQAEFLVTAALGSGYFLRRQYDDLHKSGSETQRFVFRLRARRHVTVLRTSDRRSVYHLNSTSMYRLLGAPGNRNSRSHSVSSVRERLMGLDFLLADRGVALLTAQDKLVHGIRVPDGRPVTVSESGELTFAYIDAGDQSVKCFDSWMRGNQELFTSLRAFRVVYVCCYAGMESLIRPVFESAILTARPGDFDAEDRALMSYFSMRKNYERCLLSQYDVAELRRLKELRQTFCSEHHEDLYRAWLEQGMQALRTSPAVSFEMRVLPHEFGCLLPAARRLATTTASSDAPLPARNVNANGEGSESYTLTERYAGEVQDGFSSGSESQVTKSV